jgi:hypothetical protein
VPLKNHGGVVIGVLQLINAKDASGTVVPFHDSIVPMVSQPRHADRRGPLPHQRAYDADHHHAGVPALAAPPAPGAGIRGRPSREDGRHRLPARPEGGADVDSGSRDGDRRHR